MYSGYFDALNVVRMDPHPTTDYPPEERCLWGGSHFDNPVDVKDKAEKTPFKDWQFDMIFCNWVIYHLDYKKVLDEMCRVLSPKGKLLVTYMHADRQGPIYKEIIARFDVISYCYLLMDERLDGRDWRAEGIWGQKK
jgi:SAM-dependent methyltransferase